MTNDERGKKAEAFRLKIPDIVFAEEEGENGFANSLVHRCRCLINRHCVKNTRANLTRAKLRYLPINPPLIDFSPVASVNQLLNFPFFFFFAPISHERSLAPQNGRPLERSRSHGNSAPFNSFDYVFRDVSSVISIPAPFHPIHFRLCVFARVCACVCGGT